MLWIVVYLVFMNIVAFVEMGYDKNQARKKGRRVPEKRLFLLAAVGGAVGAWIGMRTMRHKTKHASFVFGIPCLIVFNFICIYGVMHFVSGWGFLQK